MLPLNGSSVYTDDTIVASYGYNNKTGYMVSYDTPEIAVKKTQFLVDRQLGGAMWVRKLSYSSFRHNSVCGRNVANALFVCSGRLLVIIPSPIREV